MATLLNPSPSPWLLLVGLVVVFSIFVRAYSTRSRTSLPLPPGPPPLPFLGNVLDFPKKHLGPEFHALSQKYGDVVSLKVLGRSVILVDTYEAACELLEKRSANYSHRPHLVMVDMTELDWIFVFQNYGPHWRKYRRALQQAFVSEAITRYFPVQLQTTRDLLRALLATPANFSAHIKFSFAATILRIVYGLDVTPGDEAYYTLVERLATVTNDIATPGQFLVEAFPSLQRLPAWFPGARFKRVAAAWRAESISIRDQLYASAKDAMGSRGVNESIITRLTDDGAEETLVRDVTATIYSSGADTTNAAVHAFVLAMAMYPDVQRKAQAELDRVVGPDRLPDFTDRAHLPYVSALVKEVLRWHVIAPVGGAHRSAADDEFRGFHIPSGALVIPNLWAMSRDPTHYPDPERLDPERFLLNGQLNPDVRDPTTFVFGFGRRICPGRIFAESSLFITCASILHALDVSAPLDASGALRTLEMKAASLAVAHPEPFECRIVARSPHMAELVRSND
uniref:Cytochrome P450 monooxygenase n=1 Tax=Trametes versicolor TaxID=5325 RepID=A0AA86J3R3_TRAVE|nr:cytochrome P450 monooxygenase [Trametes versicolor]